MEFKDNRSKSKRNKMRHHHRKNIATEYAPPAKAEPIPGVIDVADSSDERPSVRGGIGKQPFHSLDELDLNNEENEHMHAGDFDLMSQQVTSHSGHFKFSSERNWDIPEGEELLHNTKGSAYFILNLHLLNVGLQTISFYKRMDLPSSMFNTEQLKSMEKAAEKAEKKYQNVLKEHEINPRNNIQVGGIPKGGSAKSQKTIKSIAASGNSGNAAKAGADDLPDELGELLNMTTTNVSKVATNAAVDTENIAPANGVKPRLADGTSCGNAEDIQQWLDNVLEE